MTTCTATTRRTLCRATSPAIGSHTHGGFQGMYGAVSGPSSIGVDGTNPLEIRTDGSGGGSSSVGVTFGDPGGSTLLFDTLTSDYGSSDPPASCAHSSYSLVRQAPVQRSDVDSHPAGFYCAGTGISLLQPALRPDGQLIVASAQNDPSDPAPSPNPLASGQPRLVTMPLSGSAGASNPSPLNFITPDGLSASTPISRPTDPRSCSRDRTGSTSFQPPGVKRRRSSTTPRIRPGAHTPFRSQDQLRVRPRAQVQRAR